MPTIELTSPGQQIGAAAGQFGTGYVQGKQYAQERKFKEDELRLREARLKLAELGLGIDQARETRQQAEADRAERQDTLATQGLLARFGVQQDGQMGPPAPPRSRTEAFAREHEALLSQMAPQDVALLFEAEKEDEKEQLRAQYAQRMVHRIEQSLMAGDQGPYALPGQPEAGPQMQERLGGLLDRFQAGEELGPLLEEEQEIYREAQEKRQRVLRATSAVQSIRQRNDQMLAGSPVYENVLAGIAGGYIEPEDGFEQVNALHTAVWKVMTGGLGQDAQTARDALSGLGSVPAQHRGGSTGQGTGGPLAMGLEAWRSGGTTGTSSSTSPGTARVTPEPSGGGAATHSAPATALKPAAELPRPLLDNLADTLVQAVQRGATGQQLDALAAAAPFGVDLDTLPEEIVEKVRQAFRDLDQQMLNPPGKGRMLPDFPIPKTPKPPPTYEPGHGPAG